MNENPTHFCKKTGLAKTGMGSNSITSGSGGSLKGKISKVKIVQQYKIPYLTSGILVVTFFI